ncbi:MAG: hypothetical protein ABI670_12900 [Chloroflexota bacterium]
MTELSRRPVFLLILLILSICSTTLSYIRPPMFAHAVAGSLVANSVRVEPGSSVTAASPITVTVQFNQPVLLASWQWLGTNGQPVQWPGAGLATPAGGATSLLPPYQMKLASQSWVGKAAAPPAPGTYGIRIAARLSGVPGGAASEETLLLDTTVTVVADLAPINRGFAFTKDGNIWLRSSDLQRERGVTFYAQPASASMPAWSPDGLQIAFIRDPGLIGGTTELWLARPDGTGPRRVSSATQGRGLAYPTFGVDGVLYVAQSRPLSAGGVELGESWDLQRVDSATGKLTPVQPGTLMPSTSPVDQRVVFVAQELTSDGGMVSGLSVANLDGSDEQVLVPPGIMNGIYAPAWSPDGSTIVFAGQGQIQQPGGGMGKVPGNAAPLAHGGTWDLWTIPASGGIPRLLSPVQEDLPYPQWQPDGKQVLFISPTGFWSVPAAGGQAVQIGASDSHSELSIFAPIPRPAQALPGQSRCFTETDHCLRGIFLQYWDSHGGLAQFGYPVTPEMVEEGRTVQYTQRARLELHTEYAGTASEVLLGRLGAVLVGSRADRAEAAFQPGPRPAGATSLYFPETRHSIGPPLRAYWESHGGLPVFGYPLSEAFQERSVTDGKTYAVQYFERNRLEYHPEFAGSQNEVQLGLLGVQEYSRRYR